MPGVKQEGLSVYPISHCQVDGLSKIWTITVAMHYNLTFFFKSGHGSLMRSEAFKTDENSHVSRNQSKQLFIL